MRTVEWAAGLLEGEGYFGLRRGRNPVVQCQMTDYEVLEELIIIFALGNIYSTPTQKDYYKPAWTWAVNGDNAISVLIQIRPYMFSRRLEVIDKIIETDNINKLVKLSELQARTERNYKILNLRKSGLTTREIGEKLGISRQTVSRVCKEV